MLHLQELYGVRIFIVRNLYPISGRSLLGDMALCYDLAQTQAYTKSRANRTDFLRVDFSNVP